mgnify:FL=1
MCEPSAPIPANLGGPKEDVPDFVEIRGEVFMRWDDFHTLNNEQEAPDERPSPTHATRLPARCVKKTLASPPPVA